MPRYELRLLRAVTVIPIFNRLTWGKAGYVKAVQECDRVRVLPAFIEGDVSAIQIETLALGPPNYRSF